MFSPFERMIGFRYLRSRRKEGFISVIAGFSFVGIALGVATLIVVMSVMNGFRSEITKKILGLNGHISVSSYERRINSFDDFLGAVKSVDGVVSAAPIVDGQAMATTKYANSGIAVKGIRLSDLTQRPLIASSIKDGFLNDLQGKDTIMIGTRMAENLGVGVGDEITLISPKGRATALGTMPRLKTYNVVAVFESGMYEYDSTFAFVPLESAQAFFDYPESVSSIEIFTKNPHNSDAISKDINAVLGGVYIVQDWQRMNASLFNALKVERTVMFLILTLIVFIAAFNIISSLIMLVNDKGHDIAILRTMGATRGMILRIFFICGASIGVVGTFLGFVLGVSFSLNIDTIKKGVESLTGSTLFDPVIYFLSELPSEVEVSDVLWSVAMGLIFSFLATIYPAWKASKQDPAEALRYE